MQKWLLIWGTAPHNTSVVMIKCTHVLVVLFHPFFEVLLLLHPGMAMTIQRLLEPRHMRCRKNSIWKMY